VSGGRCPGGKCSVTSGAYARVDSIGAVLSWSTDDAPV